MLCVYIYIERERYTHTMFNEATVSFNLASRKSCCHFYCLSHGFNVYVYIYIYSVCICICIYVYTEREIVYMSIYIYIYTHLYTFA